MSKIFGFRRKLSALLVFLLVATFSQTSVVAQLGESPLDQPLFESEESLNLDEESAEQALEKDNEREFVPPRSTVIPTPDASFFRNAPVESTRSLSLPLSSEALEEIAEYDRSVYEFYRWNLKHTRRTLVWQHISGIIIFMVVLAVVSGGIYFSCIQFKTSKSKEESQTTVKLGAAGIEVTSPFIGFLTLTVSLAFLYLYLGNVYPLTILNSVEGGQSESSSLGLTDPLFFGP